MKIIIDTIPLLAPLTGIGNCIYSLVSEFQRLRPDISYTYYYGYFSKKFKPPATNNKFYYLKKFLQKMPVIYTYAREAKNIATKFQLRKYDIYFEPNYIPLDIKAKKVITTVYDFSFYRHPEWHPEGRVEYFSKNFLKRIKKSDVIITISEYIKEEALEILKMENARIVTIYLGYNPLFTNVENEKIQIKLPENFLLFVGSIEPRKNLISLLKAYLLLPKYIKKNYKLLLAGFKGWNNKEMLDMLDKTKGNIEYIGYVDNEVLSHLYRKAKCFIYPSLYEGFGLPPLEAMACGCPVVVSNVASLPEVCGDAAYYVDPHNVESIAEGMYKVLTNEPLRQSLIQKGLERAKLFSWEKSAKEHIKVFEEVLKS